MQQLGVAGGGKLGSAVVPLLGPGRVGGEEEVAAVGVEAEPAARFSARDRAEAAEVRSAGEHRGAGHGREARPAVLGSEERARDRGDEVDSPGEATGHRPDDASGARRCRGS